MAQLDDIIAPVQDEFEEFRRLLHQTTLSEESSFMRPITRNILRSTGKQMRPILTLLTAQLHGEVNQRVLAAAVLIEMIHWATLIHDDVIDEAYIRRGEWTPNALLGSKAAVLTGDYLFSKGLRLAAEAGCGRSILSATRAIEQIVDGELLQMEHAKRMDTTEAIYTEIINHKTGVLLASGAECGTAEALADPAGAASETVIQNMFRFGSLLGLAFQVKDDLLDYGFTTAGKHTTGKELGNDLKEGKITLPLIHALAQKPGEQKQVRKHLKRVKLGHYPKSMDWLQRFVLENGGAEYAASVMKRYHDEAMQLLDPYPDSAAKTALKIYADFVIGRKY